MKKGDPAQRIQDIQNFGEFGGVNPSITDSSTYTFLQAQKMEDSFEKNAEGCYLYSRHLNPSSSFLAKALSLLENTESAQLTASGMAAISSVILQLCNSGDEIISNRTIYGGTYALFKNYLQKFNIKVHFVDTTNENEIIKYINSKTKVVYCETLSNPLLEFSNIKNIAKITKQNNIRFVVDNTFAPLMISPIDLGADVVVHSLTKFINGNSDLVAGVVCSSKEFIDSLIDVNIGTIMLLGPVLDSIKAASILKNLRTLHLRIAKHSENAQYLAEYLQKNGIKVKYPGLKSYEKHEIVKNTLNSLKYGFGAILLIDVNDKITAYKIMEEMQNNNIGYLAVSLGFYKTLFSSPVNSTSSEMPEEYRKKIGLNQGIIRFSVGLDSDIHLSSEKILNCIRKYLDH